MPNRIDNVLQWLGAVMICAGHTLNSLNIDYWNIVCFLLGTLAFMAWSTRTKNIPQTTVNIVALAICSWGLIR
jgi:hypothetical protein